MLWKSAIKEFKNYLQLERSLADNSIEAYVHDIEKLHQFLELSQLKVQPAEVTSSHLLNFLQYIGELGMSAHSQARILSGIKSFYKYLLMEDIIKIDPSHLLESPKLGRKLPDTLSIIEIDTLLSGIDLSTLKVLETGLL
jgi:integrase/recombinase XerD